MTEALIDGDVLHHTALWKSEDLGMYQENSERILSSWLAATACSSYRMAVGGPKNFRKDFYPDYKDIPARVKSRKTAVEHAAEAKDWFFQQPNVFIADGFEADDLLGIWMTETEGTERVMLSVDKDLLQVPGLHYNPHYLKQEFQDVTVAQSFRYLQYQFFLGDYMDRIPGLDGIGPKKAEAFLLKGVDPLDVYRERYGMEEGTSRFLFSGTLLFLWRHWGDSFSIDRYLELKDEATRSLELLPA